jgi:hypothetical protein
MEYDGVNNILRACTRKGSNLTYDKEDLVKAIAMRDRETLIAEGEYVSKNYKSKES